MKGVSRFGKKSKLAPRYIGPFEILERVNPVAYRLALLPKLSQVDNVFHVSMLRKYIRDPYHMIDHSGIVVNEDLGYEEKPMRIIDRQVKQLRNKSIPMVKVEWKEHYGKDATWEMKEEMKIRHPESCFLACSYFFYLCQLEKPFDQDIFQQLSIGATATVSPSVGIAEAQRRSLDPLAEGLRNQFKPSLSSDKTKYYLLASFVLHIKHSESKDSAVSPRILLSGPAGSEIYQEKSSKALAHHFRAKLLGSFTTGPKQILEVLMAQLCQEHRRIECHATYNLLPMLKEDYLKRKLSLPLGPFGKRDIKTVKLDLSFLNPVSLVLMQKTNCRAGVKQRTISGQQQLLFDKPIPKGQDLGGLCEAGHGFFCNDIDKFLLENSEAHQVIKYLIHALPSNVVVIGSHTDTENSKEKVIMTPNLASIVVLIRNVPDCDELGTLSIVDQTLTIETVNSIPFCNSGSIQYGLDALRETQTDLNSSEKSLEDVVKENEFEKRLLADVIPPNEIGVKFDDVGVLENVKDTLRELVMLPLQRPELFSKGQLRKLSEGILLFGPPGTGKTMLAKAVATEAGANFTNSSMSSIASKWYGDPEKYVRAVFSLASKIAPSVIFIDEVDSMLRQRRNQEHKSHT
ncbi:hypothetical protein HYC85_006030 [Camellia sinensis]|uniref:Chromo domain-containing protein n=1 Tax=Camellia sinensis TaxID=4442 RepID=A0A7J7I222_CAMSI|nr:hypothetical protein HYC85_006030 [Camellia sinensis]